MTPPCATCQREMLDYALGELAADAAASYEHHLADSPACRDEARALAALYRATRALPEPQPSAALLARLRAEAAAAVAPPKRSGFLAFLLSRPWGVPLWAPALAAGLVVVVLVRQQSRLMVPPPDKGDRADRGELATRAAPAIAQTPAAPAAAPQAPTAIAEGNLKALGYQSEVAKDETAAAKKPAEAARTERDDKLAAKPPARARQEAVEEQKRAAATAGREKENAQPIGAAEPSANSPAADAAPAEAQAEVVAGGVPVAQAPPAPAAALAAPKVSSALDDHATTESLRHAELNLSSGKLDDAEAKLEELSRVAATPELQADALLRLGDIYFRRGHLNQAREAYRRAATLDPKRQTEADARLKRLAP